MVEHLASCLFSYLAYLTLFIGYGFRHLIRSPFPLPETKFTSTLDPLELLTDWACLLSSFLAFLLTLSLTRFLACSLSCFLVFRFFAFSLTRFLTYSLSCLPLFLLFLAFLLARPAHPATRAASRTLTITASDSTSNRTSSHRLDHYHIHLNALVLLSKLPLLWIKENAILPINLDFSYYLSEYCS